MAEKEASPLAEWLQTYHWDYFLTITSKYPRHDSIAFMRDAWDYMSRPWFGNVGRAFFACEPHKFSRNLHIHAIVAFNDDFDRCNLPWEVERGLNSKFGRSRVELVKGQDMVSSYCTKYATKYTDGDNYDFFGNWQKP